MSIVVPIPNGELQSLKIKNKVASQACNACKKRKVKCIGNPCAYCIKKNYVCQFNIGKKRGPPKKMRFPKGVQECGSMSVVLLNHIQSSMDAAYRKNNFIDFYFQYIGRPIPISSKNPLLASSDSELNSDLITQLYIVSAHVMKFFGNSDLELQCIDKAQRYASNLFNCDTVESATSLMMMALYVGGQHPKHATYMNLAFNITDLPVLKNSVEAMKIKYACQTQLVFLDNTLTTKQKYQHVVEKIFNKAEASSPLSSAVTPVDWVSILSIKIKYMLLSYGEYDDSSNRIFIQTLMTPARVLSADNYAAMKALLKRLDDVVELMDQSDSKYILSLFSSSQMHFLVEWRSGNTETATESAEKAVKIFCEHKHILGLWHHSGFLNLLSVPYFLQINGKTQKAQEILNSFEQSAVNATIKEQLRVGWKELCLATGIYSVAEVKELGMDYQTTSEEEQSPGSSPPYLSPPSPSLSPPPSPETLSISQSILNSFEQSISQHTTQPISHIISPTSYYTPQQPYQTTTTTTQFDQQQMEQQMEQQQMEPQQFDQQLQQFNPQQQQLQQLQQQQQQQQLQQFNQQLTQQTFLSTNNYTNNLQHSTFTFGTDMSLYQDINNINNINNNAPITDINGQSILLFDNDMLSELLFTPIIPPVINDNMYN